MSQLDLLSRPAAPVQPAAVGLPGPRLWIRRLAIWRTRDAERPVRDISFKPGLNVIWSPDPSETPSSDPNAPQALGHGGGKTLLCRLIRYCLGEGRFATDALAERIQAKFKDGFVGAIVVVDGVEWSVVRPIGFLGNDVAVAGVPLDEVVAGDEHETGMKPLVDAIAAAFIGPEVAALISDGTSRTAWLIALAWLTRDQECRFDDVLDWRSPASESDSPVRARDVGKSDRLDFLRALIRAIAPEEQTATRDRAEVKERRDAAETTARHHEWDVMNRRSALIRALSLDDSKIPPGPLAIEPLRQAARAKLGSAALVGAAEQGLDQLERTRDDAAEAANEISGTISALKRQLPLQSALVNRLRGEYPDIELELRDVETPMCEVCEVPIERALADGCKLSLGNDSKRLADLRARRLRTAREIEMVQEQIAADEAELDNLTKQGHPAALRALRAAAAAVAEARAVERERTQAWDNLRAVGDLEAAHRLRDAAKADFEQLDQDYKDRAEAIASLRGAQGTLFQALSERFDSAVRQLARGSSGSVQVSGSGLRANVQFGAASTSTAAIESLKVLAFDLAVLMLSIEGKTALPAFLVHDSPREADLGLAAYHPLFEVARSLEAIGPEPSFQYIVTTTTKPPDLMQKEPWMRCKLSSAPPTHRLLTEDL